MARKAKSATDGPKTPGRKRLDESKPAGSNRRNLTLTDADMAVAAAIGDGNASKGIRVALEFYKENTMFSFYSAGDGSVAVIPSTEKVRVSLGSRETTVPLAVAEDAVRNFAVLSPDKDLDLNWQAVAIQVAIAIMHRDGMQNLPGHVRLDGDGYVIPGFDMAKADVVTVSIV